MKRLSTTLVLFLSIIFLVGCGKDNQPTETLNGTKWMETVTGYLGMREYVVFTSDENFQNFYGYSFDAPDGSISYGTYKVEGDNVSFITHSNTPNPYIKAFLSNNKTQMEIYYKNSISLTFIKM